MTELPTAEWCHDVAILYDGRAGLQRSAGQYREANQDTRISAALHIAANVLEEDAAEKMACKIATVMGNEESDGWQKYILAAKLSLACLKEDV